MNYLPNYYEKVHEMNLLTQAQEPEIEQLWQSLKEVDQNQFIETADHQRLGRWEALLNIRPDLATQSLDYRKAIVLLRLAMKPPLSQRWLENVLNDRVGEGNHQIGLNYEHQLLTIQIIHDHLGLIDDLRTFLREMIPANLSLIVRRAVIFTSEKAVITPVGLSKMFPKHLTTPEARNRVITQALQLRVTPTSLVRTMNTHLTLPMARPKVSIELQITPVAITKTGTKHLTIMNRRNDHGKI